MKKVFLFVIGLTAALCITAQEPKHTLTLNEAMNSWQLIRPKYPAGGWQTGSKGEDMPYDAARADDDGGTFKETGNEEAFTLEFTNRQRVWRYATRGDYWLVSTATGEKRQLGAQLPEASLMFAKISPDGKHVAYVSKNNIYMEACSMTDTSITPLTTDGSETIVNGTFDWVYEEEFDCRDGFRWSSDSRRIAFWQSDTEGTGWFEIINNVDSIYPTVSRFPYPKAGTTNSAVRIGVIDVNKSTSQQVNESTSQQAGGQEVIRWLAIPGDQRENYLPRMEFIPGTNTLMIQQMNRAQNTNRVWTTSADVEAPLTLLCTDEDDAWVETNDNIHWLKDNKYFIFTSERDGWRHLYRVTADGKKWTCITQGDFDVINEVAYDERRGYIYFTASPDHAIDRYLFRTQVMGKGKVENITAQCHATPESGQYSYNFSPNYDYAVERFSSATCEPRYTLVKCDKRGRWQTDHVLEENVEAQQAWANLAIGRKEFAKCQGGDRELDAWIIKPYDFDPTRKYPVIDFVYGEPASATVQNDIGSLFWYYLANQGYIIVSIENRGAAAPRGREWRKCIYGEVGVAASEDQARGVISLCRQFEWMDSTRIGVTGWSGGGSQTLNCMFRYPEVFKTGVAVAFVADQRLYDTIYQERYMNTPQANPDGYFRGSPINYAEGLKGSLLLLHGTGDDNVHYQNCEMLANRLISLGKRFYQVSYPMRTHGISEGRGTSRHLRETLIDFFNKNL
ncbi:MAG: DPP IV N-terminal domain-containing protein [Bacteroidaceae bacterium]|nr:DPP IV N-terminal domain-containing protein [Bacteroidaceae bacterium]